MTDEKLQQRLDQLENEVAAMRRVQRRRSIRKRSEETLLGLPLYDVALGPDPETGELRGHARGFFAVGDTASGVVALGGLATGVVAFGGLSVGVLSFGGFSVGLLGAVGGFALGGVALGGAAIGGVALGGGAAGYYACGGGAVGEHVLSASRQDPEALRFFAEWIPGFEEWWASR